MKTRQCAFATVVRGTCTAAVAVLVVGCGKQEAVKGTDTTPAAPSSASTPSGSAPAPVVATRRPDRPEHPCSFKYGDGSCAGTLAAPVPTWDKDLKQYKSFLKKKLGSPRMLNQYGQTFVNKDARNMDFDLMKPGEAVVVAAIHYEADSPADVYYHAGNGVFKDDDLQTVFFVVERPATLPPTTSIGMVVAIWHLYGVYGSGREVRPIGDPGAIVECTHESKANFDKKEPNSTFGSCPVVAEVDSAAANFHFTLEEALSIVADQPAVEGAGTKMNVKRVAQSLRSGPSIAAFLKEVQSVFALAQKGPAWFTCGLGCCTAEAN